VIHLAAHVKVNDSINIPGEYYYNNIFGTMSVLEQINFDHFIFASTGVASNPTNPYALSKRCAEDVVKSFCEKKQKDFTTFRFYNVIGQTVKGPTNEDGLFYNLLKAKENGKFTIFGDDYDSFDGTAVRDYVHVNEICMSIKKSIEKPANSLENLGTGTGYTVKQIVDKFKEVNNCDFDVVYQPRRSGDLERSVLDNPSLYFEKMYSFDELLKID
jgi:UDP-glucose 4-epimerase